MPAFGKVKAMTNGTFYTIVDLEALSDSQIHELVALHQETLPYSIGSKLGAKQLFDYYKILKIDDFTVCKVAIQDNRAVGFIAATLSYKATSNLIRNQSGNILRQVTKPRFVVDNLASLVDIFLIKIKLFRIDPTSSYIILFFVSPMIRKNGVGESLLNEIISIHKKINNIIYVDTRKTSHAAIRLYNRLGFSEIQDTPKSLILRKLPK